MSGSDCERRPGVVGQVARANAGAPLPELPQPRGPPPLRIHLGDRDPRPPRRRRRDPEPLGPQGDLRPQRSRQPRGHTTPPTGAPAPRSSTIPAPACCLSPTPRILTARPPRGPWPRHACPAPGTRGPRLALDAVADGAQEPRPPRAASPARARLRPATGARCRAPTRRCWCSTPGSGADLAALGLRPRRPPRLSSSLRSHCQFPCASHCQLGGEGVDLAQCGDKCHIPAFDEHVFQFQVNESATPGRET